MWWMVYAMDKIRLPQGYEFTNKRKETFDPKSHNTFWLGTHFISLRETKSWRRQQIGHTFSKRIRRYFFIGNLVKLWYFQIPDL